MISAVSYQTYKMFAKRYNIRLTTGTPKRLKSMKQLAKSIRAHESSHNVRDGLYV